MACQPPRARERLRIAVVGGGLVAQRMHLPNLAAMEDRFELAALVEPDEGLRAVLTRRHGIPRGYACHEDLLQDGGVDALAVCSPNATHAPVTLAALAAGAHVLVEKPLCIAAGDADAIVRARDRAGCVVQIGYMKRYDEAVERLLAELPSHAGALRHVDAVTCDPGLARLFPARAGERPAPELATALAVAERAQVERAIGPRDATATRCFVDVFLGALVHDVNLVHGALERMGEPLPARACGAASWNGGRAASVELELASGARWSSTWLALDGLAEFREQLALRFDDAIATLSFPAPYVAHAPTRYELSRAERDVQVLHGVRSHREAFVRELEHFHDCIVTGAACRTPPEQARLDIAVLAELFALAEAAAVPA